MPTATRLGAASLLILALVLPVRGGIDTAEPPCLRPAAEGGVVREVPVAVESDVSLSGRLFLPLGPGPHPAVVLLHGGGHERLNEAPLFYAPLLAQCGIAALVYDKRGTGFSEGVWEAADFDDFIADARAAVAFLQQRPEIDARQVGLVGFSQGGRLAPVVAVRHEHVAFVVSISAPFTSVIETRLYALEQWLRRRGVQGTDLELTLDLWRQHLTALAAGDSTTFSQVDRDRDAAHRLDDLPLPPSSDRISYTPIYNSLAKDYTRELRRLRVPMLALYGERDAIVPVEPSIQALEQALGESRSLVDIVVVPFANHSFLDLTFNRRIRVENTVLTWVLTHLRTATATGSDAVSTQ